MPKFIIIGSAAIQQHYPGFREPSDLDIATRNIKARLGKIEVKPIPALFNYCDTILPSPDVLYTLKVSHSFWNVHWDKTMRDISFLEKQGCEVIEPLFEELYQYWLGIHGNKSKISLNKTKDEFFNKSVRRDIDHDKLHELVAYYSQPLYRTVLKDGYEVLLDKNKFELLSFEDKLKLAREEIYAIALERYVIPDKIESSVAYHNACKDIVTRLSKGWFPRFIVENWYILQTPDKDFIKCLENIDL